MRLFMFGISLLLTTSAFAANTLIVSEEMKSTSLREYVCETVYFDYFDYGEMFDGDLNGAKFNNFCAQQSIVINKKIIDKFPAGQVPLGFDQEITTKMFFTFDSEDESCTGSLTRMLASSGFQINDLGEIERVPEVLSNWSIDPMECD